jgi:uncharacterized phage protein (TIGR01671 family)
MREIKFAFWHKLRREMWLVQSIDWQQNEVCNGGDIAKLNDGQLIQYTGLKDRNGKEIFEGDIIEVGLWLPYKNTQLLASTYLDKVVFDEEWLAFRLSGEGSYLDFKDLLREDAELKVIGNIYENPELLTKN